jgi:menaquinol-cytochrome c reductase iron-sulfur subunit
LADQQNKQGRAPEKPKPAGYFEGETMTRRTMFGLGGQAFGAGAVLLVALPTVGFALAPIFDRPEEMWEGVGHPDDFTADTYRQAVITIVENVGDSGKTTVYIRRGSPDLDEDPASFIAISTRCAHLGCPVRYIQASQKFVCPCHGGVYDSQGKVQGGPPVRPLDRFETRVRNRRVEVGQRFSLNSQLERFPPRDPSNHLDGLWKYLYPPRPTT